MRKRNFRWWRVETSFNLRRAVKTPCVIFPSSLTRGRLLFLPQYGRKEKEQLFSVVFAFYSLDSWWTHAQLLSSWSCCILLLFFSYFFSNTGGVTWSKQARFCFLQKNWWFSRAAVVTRSFFILETTMRLFCPQLQTSLWYWPPNCAN